MNVLLTSLFYEYRFGGAEMVAHTLRQSFAERLGWRVDVLCYDGGTETDVAGNVFRIPRAGIWQGRDEQFKRACLFLGHRRWDQSLEQRALDLPLAGKSYDWICCADVNALPLSQRLAQRWNKPLMSYLQEALPRRLAKGQALWPVRAMLNAMLARREKVWQRALRDCRAVACVSDFIRERGRRFAGDGQWNTIYPPAEEYVLQPPTAPPPNGNAAPSLLFIGRLSQEKGLHLLLQAWSRLPRETTLTIVGLGGPLGAAVERAARADARITVLPAVPHREVPALMARHQVVCCPSVVEESFGRTALEGRAAQRCVVVTDRGALPEVVAGYPLAWTVPASQPHDAFVTALATALSGAIAERRALSAAEVERERAALSRFGAAAVAAQFGEMAAVVTR